MSRAHVMLLKKLCHHGATFEKAKAILHTASLRTAQGSGYELGQGASGLPAICAYIAAEELGDADVTEKIAQTASCLKPKVFKTTLNTVKGALAAASRSATSSPSKAARSVSYNTLLTENRIGRKLLVQRWMQDAEDALLSNRETRRKFSNHDAVTVAVFCWTCQLMGSGKKVNVETMLDTYDIPSDVFTEITEALHEQCRDTAKKIEEGVAALKANLSPTKSAATSVSPVKPAASPVKSSTQVALPPPLVPPTPSKTAALTRSPSKSALRAPSADLSPRKTPSHKRKVAFDGPLDEADELEFDALATPSKRQKFSSPMKELPGTTSTPRKSSRLAQLPIHEVSEETELGEQAAGGSTRDVLDLLRHTRGAGTGSVPSTPRKTRTASQPSSTHSNRSTRSARSQNTMPSKRMTALPTVFEERVRRRRYRPAFADTQQWLRGDARMERTLKPWAERWRELVGKCGGDVWEAARAAGEDRRGVLAVEA
ncbi:hypothetical protein C2E23DRAFT_325016 [Lenzites betulinus]|nr:hypothetical protein C2E23DRAFT_325016 [Lenzites betulinus]